MIARSKRATYADIEALPQNAVGEIMYGVLHVNPRMAVGHARVGSRLGVQLGPFDGGRSGPGGWIILDEPELHFGAEPDVLVPDVAGWRENACPYSPARTLRLLRIGCARSFRRRPKWRTVARR